eukprot:6202223-Pleurochrysis_carterae.AAC.6
MNLASNNVENQRAIVKANVLPKLVRMLGDESTPSTTSRRAREYVAGALMNLTLKQPKVQNDVAKAGAMPLLVKMLLEDEVRQTHLGRVLSSLAVRSLGAPFLRHFQYPHPRRHSMEAVFAMQLRASVLERMHTRMLTKCFLQTDHMDRSLRCGIRHCISCTRLELSKNKGHRAS